MKSKQAKLFLQLAFVFVFAILIVLSCQSGDNRSTVDTKSNDVSSLIDPEWPAVLSNPILTYKEVSDADWEKGEQILLQEDNYPLIVWRSNIDLGVVAPYSLVNGKKPENLLCLFKSGYIPYRPTDAVLEDIGEVFKLMGWSGDYLDEENMPIHLEDLFGSEEERIQLIKSVTLTRFVKFCPGAVDWEWREINWDMVIEEYGEEIEAFWTNSFTGERAKEIPFFETGDPDKYGDFVILWDDYQTGDAAPAIVFLSSLAEESLPFILR